MYRLYLLVVLTSVVGTVRPQRGRLDPDHDPDMIVFPDMMPNYRYGGRSMEHEGREETEVDHKEIPLTLIQQLNELDDIGDIDNLVEGDVSDFKKVKLSNRFGGFSGSERGAVQIAKPARCMPTLQPVELKSSNESGTYYLPSCTRVNRCTGCCSHSLLSCQPTLTETLSFQVMVTQYNGGEKLSMRGKEIVLVEQHVKCKCDCVVKKEDCNVFQEYKKEECRCVCTNTDEKKKCEKNIDIKLWDPKICKCRCREMGECTTGFMFDQNKCTCVRIPVRRRFAEIGSSKERNFSEKEHYDVDIE